MSSINQHSLAAFVLVLVAILSAPSVAACVVSEQDPNITALTAEDLPPGHTPQEDSDCDGTPDETDPCPTDAEDACVEEVIVVGTRPPSAGPRPSPIAPPPTTPTSPPLPTPTPPPENDVPGDVDKAVEDVKKCIEASSSIKATRISGLLEDVEDFEYYDLPGDRVADIQLRYWSPSRNMWAPIYDKIRFDRGRVSTLADQRNVTERQVFAHATLHELRHAEHADRCAKHANAEGLPISDCKELGTSDYVEGQMAGFAGDYESWTDRQAMADFKALFGSRSPIDPQYDPATDANPQCLHD